MHNYEEFRRIVQEIVVCRECEDCYKPNDPTLVYGAGEKADVVLISESPYNFPNEIKSFTVEDHMRDLSTILARVRNEGHDARIHEFIFCTFRPLFDTEGEDMAALFAESVYWTHAAKKSFKSVDSSERLEAAMKCAEKLIIEELASIEPKLLITVSSLATRILFGLGFKDLFDQHIRLNGELLELGKVLEMSAPRSLMVQSISKFTSGWAPKLAVLPNPSGKAVRWQNYAYEINAKVADSIHKQILETISS
mgnify:CR=1 FL=1